MASGTQTIAATRYSIDGLRPGIRVDADLYDAEGVLLLAAGSTMTANDVALLRQHGDVFTISGGRKNKNVEAPRTTEQQLDEVLADPSRCVVETNPTRARPRPVLPVAAFQDEVQAGIGRYRSAVISLSEIVSDIRANRLKTAVAAQELVGGFVGLLSTDRDILPAISVFREKSDEYLFNHSLKVALLSMTIGDALGLNEGQLLELGMGALLMDIGMLNVPAELRMAARRLDQLEQLEIQRHPIHTLHMLEGLFGISPAIMFVGYQCHERGDGSGYPKRRKQFVVHTYARIVAIADTFAAMTTDRPHRRAFTPYEAMRFLLEQGAAGKYDRHIIKAFLDRVSLLPIGSYVKLSTGDTAKVIRPNPGMYTKPIVMLVGSDGVCRDHAINLARATNIRVIQAFGLNPPGAMPND